MLGGRLDGGGCLGLCLCHLRFIDVLALLDHLALLELLDLSCGVRTQERSVDRESGCRRHEVCMDSA